MRNYVLDDRYIYHCNSITDGTQDKYHRNEYFYKIDKVGNEGFVEYLVSLILKHSTLPKSLYVSYEYCFINNRRGCRSKSFLKKDEIFVSINRLYQNQTGKSLSDILWYKSSEVERLNYLISISKSVEVNSFKNYLQVLIQLDMLILNIDRHVSNYGFIYNHNTGIYKPAKIFDNGLSLGTRRCTNASCTIGGSFEGQVIAFGYPIEPAFKINYKSLFKELSIVKQFFGNYTELDVLQGQLLRYKNLFKLE